MHGRRGRQCDATGGGRAADQAEYRLRAAADRAARPWLATAAAGRARPQVVPAGAWRARPRVGPAAAARRAGGRAARWAAPRAARRPARAERHAAEARGEAPRAERDRWSVGRWARRRSGRRRGRRRRSRYGRRRRLHDRTDVHATERSDVEGGARRAHLLVHHEFGRQQDLHGPGHDADLTEGVQPRHQRVRPGGLQGRDRRPVHGHSRRPDTDGVHTADLGGAGQRQARARQPDRLHRSRAAAARLHRDRRRERRRRQPGQRARPGIRHDVRPLRAFHRHGGAARRARERADQGRLPEPRLHDRSGGPGIDRLQLGRRRRADDGLVPPRSVPQGDHLLRHVRRPAGHRRARGADVSPRRLGVPLRAWR